MKWTYKPTWPDSRKDIDRIVLKDDIVVARTYQHDGGPSSGQWSWFLTRGGIDGSGTADSLEEALEAVRQRYQ